MAVTLAARQRVPLPLLPPSSRPLTLFVCVLCAASSRTVVVKSIRHPAYLIRGKMRTHAAKVTGKGLHAEKACGSFSAPTLATWARCKVQSRGDPRGTPRTLGYPPFGDPFKVRSQFQRTHDQKRSARNATKILRRAIFSARKVCIRRRGHR